MSVNTLKAAFDISHLTGEGLEHLVDIESGKIVISYFDGNECDKNGVVYEDNEEDTLDAGVDMERENTTA